ncbi:MAG: hypothetical protein WDM79_14395 [Terricaulis sp.]
MRMLFVIAVLALAACNPSAPDPDAAAKLGAPESLERALPPEGAQRYVGMWATAQDDCPSAPWEFRADGLSTQGEVSCRFNIVNETETGYAIDATCTAEGPPAPYQIQLAFAESAHAMLLTGGPWMGESTGLVYCGPLPAE